MQDFDFTKDIVEWHDAKKVSKDVIDPCCLLFVGENLDILHESFHSKILTKAQVKDRPDAKKSMDDEIRKFEQFKAFERVKDNGQLAIKTRWVYTEDLEQSKGCELKSRLCMRGDKDFIRADSPTAHKDTLKLVLAVAANEKFDIISGNIKSAFLQSRSLSREVFVVPPKEANEEGTFGY